MGIEGLVQGQQGLVGAAVPQFQPNINQLGIWWQIFQWSKIGNKSKWLGETFWFFKATQGPKKTTAGHQLATLESDTLFHSGPGSLSPVYTSLSSIHQITLLLTTTNSRLEILPRSLRCHLASTVTRPLITFLNFPTQTFHFNQISLLTSSLTPSRWPLFYPPLYPNKAHIWSRKQVHLWGIYLSTPNDCMTSLLKANRFNFREGF